jgi:ComF family protein
MIETVKNQFLKLFDLLLPRRTDFEIVRNLSFDEIITLPKAEKVSGCDWIHPLFRYKDKRVKAIIWELKYKNNTAVLDHLGRLLYEEILELMYDAILFDNDTEFLLVPIPISNSRRIERGYNQSEYIAKAILENDSSHSLLYAPQWFSKVIDTPRQSRSASKAERMKNLTGCFEADPRVQNKYVILIDDVVTTGSTLCEARKTLLEAGARNVFAYTVAH